MAQNKITTKNNQLSEEKEQYENQIYRYCEIVYHMLQNNPELYETLLPESTFKLIAINSEEENNKQKFKTAA